MSLCLFVLPFPNEKHRQLYHKELSPLSLPRSTTCILIFSVQREYIFQTKHHSLCTIIYIFFSFSFAIFFHCFLLFSSLAFGFWNRSVIFGMLIALPITLVYYILMGLWRGKKNTSDIGIHADPIWATS